MTEPNPGRLLATLRELPQDQAYRLIQRLEAELLVLSEYPPEGRQDEVARLSAIVRQGRRYLDKEYPPVEQPSMGEILDKVKGLIE